MCIRDRAIAGRPRRIVRFLPGELGLDERALHESGERVADIPCLLYTSDAADERSSVDLGGRRIIKKKKRTEKRGRHSVKTTYKQTTRERTY